MKSLFPLLILIILLPSVSLAQKNFTDGYVLLPGGDTLHGEINNGSYSGNARLCLFKAYGSEDILEYSPEDISGYRFTEGKYYVSRRITIDGIPTQIFLEYLIKGALDVFYYKDMMTGDHYFIDKDTISLEEITYSKDIVKIDGKEYFTESKKGAGLLVYYTMDDPGLMKDINKMTEYNHKNLISLASRYHQETCPDLQCIIYEKKIPVRIKFSMEIGESSFVIPNPNVMTEQRNYKAPSSGDWRFNGGINVLFQQPQTSERLYLGLGMYYEYIGADYIHNLRFPISINYLNPKKNISPYMSYSADLDNFTFQSSRMGLRYNRSGWSMLLYSELRTYFIYKPWDIAVRFGLISDLK